jgi:hypothetical protein
MDETGNHQVKWNKSDWERQQLHFHFHMRNLNLKRNVWHECKTGGLLSVWGTLRRGRVKGEGRGGECDWSISNTCMRIDVKTLKTFKTLKLF